MGKRERTPVFNNQFIIFSGIGNYIQFNSKKYSCFGGNNYLKLANHPV